VLAGALGAVGIVAIEIGAILALGRVFARTSHWWLAALAGVVAVIVASTLRPGFRPRRALLLAGVALALGAVLGGAFPHRPD
jgi:hypothetical protein